MNDQQETAYQRWYKNHKHELAEKRRERYQNDPEYRQKALDRKAKQLEKHRALNQRPAGYNHTLQDMAKHLDVTVWTLREWRKKDYFPEPMKVGRNLLFTDTQLGLLGALQQFLKEHGKRLSRASREKLQDVTNFIHANWN
jgi:hypothetical protein